MCFLGFSIPYKCCPCGCPGKWPPVLKSCSLNLSGMVRSREKKKRFYKCNQILVVLACLIYFFYNWACHAWIIWGWLCYYLDSTFRVDSWACSPLSLWGMINCKRQNVAKEFKVNLIVYNSVKVWRDIVSFFGRKDLVSMLTPICGNADFIPATPVALNLLEICLKMVLSCLFSNFIFSMAFPRSIFFGTCRFVTLLGS